MRFKKTEVCQTCAKMKNVCQTCLLDLEYGLPVEVRDSALSLIDDMPKSDVNKEFYIQNMERQMAATSDGTTPGGPLANKTKAHSEMLLRLARTTPYYKRNRPHICSFWVKGECKRGEECPYRHEKPTDPDDPLADQNIKDRYYGVNDPVADKLLKRAAAMPRLEPPEDKSITTLYVGNLGERIGEKELRDHFYQYGELRSINVVAKQQYAFVQFTLRSAGELAAERTFNKLIIQGRRLNIKWGRSQARQGIMGIGEGESLDDIPAPLEPVPGLPTLPPPPEELQNNFFNLQPAASIPLPPGQPMVNSVPVMAGSRPPMPPGTMPPRPPVPPPGSMPTMPPPLGIASRPPGIPPPPGHLPPLQPPPFFPPHLRAPLRPPPGVRPPTYFPQPPPIPGIGPPPPLSAGIIHYPSQDPTQMGANPDKK